MNCEFDLGTLKNLAWQEMNRLTLPPWIKQKAPDMGQLENVKNMLDTLKLPTVCESARCPNICDCFSRGLATVMIMGETCTRNCRFCAVGKGIPIQLDSDEPLRVAELVRFLNLKHIVITSVTRDDLIDGGAGHFAQTVESIRSLSPTTTIEILVPDFQGNLKSLAMLVAAKPNIISHNLETVPRLYTRVRPQADYSRSLQLLNEIKKEESSIITKSGIMVGLGENKEEIYKLMDELLSVGCDIMTIGQYLRPSADQLAVEEFIKPEIFELYARVGEQKGFKVIYSAPLVRSSYNADQLLLVL